MNDFLLNLFTGADNNKPLQMFPNLLNGTVYATDSYVIATIPEAELFLNYSTNLDFPNAQKIIDDFSKEELQSVRVNVADLGLKLAKARIEVDKDSITCQDCDGGGSVTFDYRDKKGNYHSLGDTCPVCYGEGTDKVNSKFARVRLELLEQEDDTKIGIYIDDLYFHPFNLYRIFMAAVLKGVDDFEMWYEPNSPTMVMCQFGNIKVYCILLQRTS